MSVGKFFGTIGKVCAGIYLILLMQEGYDRHRQNKRAVVSQKIAENGGLAQASFRSKSTEDLEPNAQSGGQISPARRSNWPAVRSSAFDREKVSVTFASLDGLERDYAGSWGVFNSGPGRINLDPNDWHVRLVLSVYQPVELSGISVLNQYALQNGYPAEGWSTMSDKHYNNKRLYPLVVFKDGEQINTSADQSIGMLARGVYKYDLFMQKESPRFGVAVLNIILGDGTYFQSPVFAQTTGQ